KRRSRSARRRWAARFHDPGRLRSARVRIPRPLDRAAPPSSIQSRDLVVARCAPRHARPTARTPRRRCAFAQAGGAMTIAERVKAVRARALIRRWEYRQRNLAHGAWDRFRSALVHARDAYAIDDATAAALLAEGFAADDRGRGLEPPRTLVWI